MACFSSLALRRKQQTKKNKTWDGDAYISLKGTKLVMVSEDGKVYVFAPQNVLVSFYTLYKNKNSMGSTDWNGENLYSGYSTYISNKEVQLDAQIPASQLPMGIRGGGNVEDDLDVSLADTSTMKLSLAKAFVSPGAFYGAPVKVKPKGPR